MDGVLIDSPKYVWKAFNFLLAKDGVHIEDSEIKEYLGVALVDLFKILKKRYGIKNYDPKEFSKKSCPLEFKYMKEELKNNKELIKLLINLKSDNYKLSVATSSQRWRAEEILNLLGIMKYFDVIVTSEDVDNHKPHPDVFLKASAKLNILPKFCLVVEDASVGIIAAKKAGMKSIALLTNYTTKEDLKDADLIINDIFELEEKLNKIDILNGKKK